MTDLRQIDLWTLDYDRLSPQAREAVLWEATRRANVARAAFLNECMTDIGAGMRRLGAGMVRLPATAGRMLAHWLDRRRARARLRSEVAFLHGLDDYALKDMGIARLDVATLARSVCPDATRAGEGAKMRA